MATRKKGTRKPKDNKHNLLVLLDNPEPLHASLQFKWGISSCVSPKAQSVSGPGTSNYFNHPIDAL